MCTRGADIGSLPLPLRHRQNLDDTVDSGMILLRVLPVRAMLQAYPFQGSQLPRLCVLLPRLARPPFPPTGQCSSRRVRGRPTLRPWLRLL